MIKVSQFSDLPDFKTRHSGQFRQHIEICSAPKFDIEQPQILKTPQKAQRRYGNRSEHQFLQPAEFTDRVEFFMMPFQIKAPKAIKPTEYAQV
jgi:hypothetical protein